MNSALTLSQLQHYLADAVRNSLPGRGVWVTAELVDVRIAGGHCYMELVEKDARGQTVAKMRANIWRNLLPSLRKKFYAATGADIVTGLKVMVGGCANHHPLYGLSFNIQDIDPSYTLGDMERLRREILDALKAENVLELQRSLHISPVPQKIAVISTAGAAGYGDFIDQLLHNTEGFRFYPCLFEAVMQGERTSASVRAALQRIEETIDFWDCVVIIRGGGATTDLNGFDELELARAVATFPLPIVVGIGHERDRTVLDEIAHTRIKTPTGVAAFFVERARGWLAEAMTRVNEITRYAGEYVNGEKRRLSQAGATIPSLASARVGKARAGLESVARILPALGQTQIAREEARLKGISALMPTIIGRRTEAERHDLSLAEERLLSALHTTLRRHTDRLASLSGLIDAYSPIRTLERGYSITRIDGRAVRKSDDVAPGAVITTQLADGTISSKVL